MIIELEVNIDGSRAIVRTPKSGRQVACESAVIQHIPTGRLLAVGEALDDVKKNVPPEMWDELTEQARPVYPFDPKQLVPELAGEFLLYQALVACLKASPKGQRSYLFRYIDRFDIRLTIAGYEQAPAWTRPQFEHTLLHYPGLRIHALSINGRLPTFTPEFVAQVRRTRWQSEIIARGIVLFWGLGA